MVILQKIFTISLILFLLACQDTKTPVKKTPVKQEGKTIVKKTKEVQKDIKPKEPLINKNNVVDFLTQYGKDNKETKAIISTRLGNIHIQLFTNTPLHRANFIFLVKQGYYNTTCFHRVVEDFIIQAGQSDNSKTVKLRKEIGSYRIPPEFRQHKHSKGSLSAARRWNNNPKKLSDAFEFFIVHKSKGLHHLDQEHTVFGKVTKGLEVVDKIAKEAIDKGEWPLNDIDLNVSVF